MCLKRKQYLNTFCWILSSLIIYAPALAQSSDSSTAGGVAVGESQGGVTDRAYVIAPPNYAYVVERKAGSFLDCGDGMDAQATDKNGRDLAPLQCGVTLTETIVIPAAAASARVVVHF